MALDRTRRPREGQRRFHGRIVPLEPVDEVPQLHAGAGATGPQPCLQGVGPALADHRRTLLHQLLHVRELCMLLEPFHEGVVFCCPFVGALAKYPRELACCGEPGGSRREPHGRAVAVGMDPLGDERTRARKALVSNLAPQARLIRTALRQPGLEVGNIAIDFP